MFYWHEDVTTGMDGLANRLESVVFLEGMGSLQDKAERLGPVQGPTHQYRSQQKNRLRKTQLEPFFAQFVCMIVKNIPASRQRTT